jgi:hypothetical protein
LPEEGQTDSDACHGDHELLMSKDVPIDVRTRALSILYKSPEFVQKPTEEHERISTIWDANSDCVTFPISVTELERLLVPEIHVPDTNLCIKASISSDKDPRWLGAL